MSTKNHTDTSNVYNQNSMGNYNMFQGSIGNNLMQMVNNPLGSSFFKNQLAQQMGMNNQIGQRNNANLLQNMRAGGGILSNSAGFMSGALNRNNLSNSMMQGNAFNSSLNSALNSRNIGLSAMQAYQPLQTGQNTTQYQSGTGTWLMPLLSAAANIAAPGLGSMLGGGSFSAGYKGGGGGNSSFGAPPSSGFMQPQMNMQTPNFYMQQQYGGQQQFPHF